MALLTGDQVTVRLPCPLARPHLSILVDSSEKNLNFFLPLRKVTTLYSLSTCLSLRLSRCLSLSLSPTLSVYVFLSVSLFLTVSLTLSLSVSRSDSLTLCLFLSVSLCPPLYLSLSLFLSLSLSLSLCFSVSLSLSLSLCLSLCLSLSLSFVRFGTLRHSFIPHISGARSIDLRRYIHLSKSIGTLNSDIYLSIYLSISVCSSIYV
ncbi:unnamed protein product [Acanthosepion pharaonis]|uniref:Uncharacterized protein n=1 Tax=Acanthosepion pharaonis TaxID=158019 RepID=A0A812E704_ACAPH|nr:unnamed protein product [Sepia pharaonis]